MENKEFEKCQKKYNIPCASDVVNIVYSENHDDKGIDKAIYNMCKYYFESGQQSVKNELAAIKDKHSLVDISKLNLNDPSDRLKWFYAIIGDIDKAAKKEDLRDEDLLEIFEEIYSANRSKWIPAKKIKDDDTCVYLVKFGKKETARALAYHVPDGWYEISTAQKIKDVISYQSLPEE